MNDDPDELISKTEERSQVNNDNQPELNERTEKNKLHCQLNQLEGSFDPEASKIIENIEQGREL
jgi:hypothetical protein